MIGDAERQILPAAMRHSGRFSVATQWYLRGWLPMDYQWAFHQVVIPNVVWLAGIASGKTTSVAASNAIDCLTIPYFRALNTSVTARQATLVFDMFMEWYEGNKRLEPLVEHISLRPYPTIKFKNFAEWEFRTAGRDARFIRGSEYDRISFDEAGLDPWGEAVKVLRGRLRGTRIDGTIRMARLDVITSPTDAPWLRERWNKGDPQHEGRDLTLYRSMRTSTYDNVRLLPAQIHAMEADYSPEMIEVELKGNFPDYGYSMFPSGHMRSCTDQSLYDMAWIGLNPETGKPKPGFVLAEDPRHGITHFELPYNPQRTYIMGGDPGTENVPKRSAAPVIVLDVTEKPYRVVYFDWVSGSGSYKPFLRSYKYALEKYNPILKGIDATGPQKALDELGFEEYGIQTDKLNFTTEKNAMLNALSMLVTNHHIAWPPIKGLLRQMGEYTIARDAKIAQDIPMTLAMLAHLARYIPAQRSKDKKVKRANHRNRKLRSNTARRR